MRPTPLVHRVFVVFAASWMTAGCGGPDAPVAARTAAAPRPNPASYDEARERLELFAEHRISVPDSETVDELLSGARLVATAAAEETVAIVRLFEAVVRENGEGMRARCLVGIATANRALAAHLRHLEYRLPRVVLAELTMLEAESPAEAAAARTRIEGAIALALEERARPLDCNEATALRGALTVLRERPDPAIDDEALRHRLRELDSSCPVD